MGFDKLRWMLLGNTVLMLCIFINQFMMIPCYIITIPAGLLAALTVFINCFLPTDKDST